MSSWENSLKLIKVQNIKLLTYYKNSSEIKTINFHTVHIMIWCNAERNIIFKLHLRPWLKSFTVHKKY